MKIPISIPKTAALKTRAVTKVEVDALAASDISEDLKDSEPVSSITRKIVKRT